MNSELTLDTAKQLLIAFSCTETKSVKSEGEKLLLRQAVELFTRGADYQNFGICADNARAGFLALVSYLKALNYEIPFEIGDIPTTEQAVYIKFNTRYTSYYLDDYTGKYRGVLISFQSSEYELINGTYGYLPLDLFGSDG